MDIAEITAKDQCVIFGVIKKGMFEGSFCGAFDTIHYRVSEGRHPQIFPPLLEVEVPFRLFSFLRDNTENKLAARAGFEDGAAAKVHYEPFLNRDRDHDHGGDAPRKRQSSHDSKPKTLETED
ncbi:hypothetical protein GGR55DRAFT_680689 [Xylaria sp. FL0064]|nr:hypothetical protein GGR55DRAFT_680689 [Xylaria sp. FL0064]